jgi:hypothetical protein
MDLIQIACRTGCQREISFFPCCVEIGLLPVRVVGGAKDQNLLTSKFFRYVTISYVYLLTYWWM